jgi:hypothetical protein
MARSLLPIKLIEGARLMKAVVTHEYGGPDVLKYEDYPDPAAVDALAPVDIVANIVRGGTAEQLVSKVRDGGIFASVTGVPEAPRAVLPFTPLRSCPNRIPRRCCIWRKRFATENLGFPSLNNCRYETRARDISRSNEAQGARSYCSPERRNDVAQAEL